MRGMDRPTVHAVVRGAVAILVLVAIADQARTLIDAGFFRPLRYFAFFTILSNLYGAVVFLALAIRRGRTESRTFDLLRGAAVVYLVVTFVVVVLLLSSAELQVGVPWVDVVVHKLFPVVLVLDWLIDPPTTRLRIRDGLVWLVFPLVWIVFSLIRGAVDFWYPYPFLDPAHGGYRLVSFYVGAIFAGFLLIGGATIALGDAMRARARAAARRA